MFLQSQVFYIDYGNGEVKPNCDIVELLPNQANLKPQATACVLYGLKPIEGKQLEGITKLHSLTNGRQLKAQFMAGKCERHMLAGLIANIPGPEEWVTDLWSSILFSSRMP